MRIRIDDLMHWPGWMQDVAWECAIFADPYASWMWL